MASRFFGTSWAIFTSCLLSGGVAVGAANAQAPADKTAEPALKGPSVGVRPDAKGKRTGEFGQDAVAKKASAKAAAPATMAEFVKAIQTLRNAPTPEANRLTADEDAKIKAALAEQEQATKTYLDAHRQEIDDLRSKLSATDRAMLDEQLQRGGAIRLNKVGFGGKNAVLRKKDKSAVHADATSDTATLGKEDAAKTRARLVELYTGRPKSQDAQTKILALLTPAQADLVSEQLKNDATHGKHGHRKGAKGK